MSLLAKPPDNLELSTCSCRWLRTGEEGIDAMLTGIGAATESIRLETYIFHVGQVADQFREALVAAAQRGVRVQVMVDALGSMNLPESFWDSLRKAGGQFTWFNPLALNRWSYRDHRKVLVCDAKISFIGGFNLADEYRGDGVTKGWRDLGLEIHGPLSEELAQSFDDLFTCAPTRPKALRMRRGPEKISVGRNWKLVLGEPGWRRGALKRSLNADLKTARSVKIICAYFLPTWRLRKALQRVSKRGGKVQLILAGKTDVFLTQLASRRLYRSFLRAGVEIYEYQSQVLHSKLFIIDNIVYAGSANMDVRSLGINYELLVRLSEPELAVEARDIFEKDLALCRRIDPATWNKSRNFWGKLRENWAYFILARIDPYFARRQRFSDW